MDELLARHRTEARDLQSRITQKKKAATKKTRKGVNDECEQLERELKEQHHTEVATLNGAPSEGNGAGNTSDAKSGGQQSVDGEIGPAVRHDGEIQQLQDLTIGVSSSQATSPSQQTAQRKPNRQKARLARRAAEQEALTEQAVAEAAAMPDRKVQEREKMDALFQKHNLTEKEIRADGHCLYSAVADQLQVLGRSLKPRVPPGIVTGQDGAENVPPHKVVRGAAANYIESHGDDFKPFLEEPLFTYVHKVRDTGTWGGQLELLALAKTYEVDISVLQGDGQLTEIEGGHGDQRPKLWLAYYRHGFGLGEHYNSLRTSR